MDFSIGSRVDFLGCTGKIKFFGLTHFSLNQEWVGVELDHKVGNNDGTVFGRRYFECKPNYGIFVLPSVLRATKTNPKKFPKEQSIFDRLDDPLPNLLEGSVMFNNESSKVLTSKVIMSIRQSLVEHQNIIKNLLQTMAQQNKLILTLEKCNKDYEEINLEDLGNDWDLEEELLQMDEEELLKQIEQLDEELDIETQENIKLEEELVAQHEKSEKKSFEKFKKQQKQLNDEIQQLENEIEDEKKNIQIPQNQILSLEFDLKILKTTLHNFEKEWNKAYKEIQHKIKNLKEEKSKLWQEFEKKDGYPTECVPVFKEKIHMLTQQTNQARFLLSQYKSGKSKTRIENEKVLDPKDKIDRSDWKEKLYKYNPPIHNLRKRIIPEFRYLTFSKIYGRTKQKIQKVLTHERINQLIVQHFYAINQPEIAEFIIDKMFITKQLPAENSYCSSLFNLSFNDFMHIYDLTLSNKDLSTNQKEERYQELEHKVKDMGLALKIKGDIFIWDEPSDNPNNIEYLKNEENIGIDKENNFIDNVRCSNVNKLIQLLLSPKSDSKFLDIFLYTYQSFLKPEHFLTKLIQGYFPKKTQSETKEEYQQRKSQIRQKIISIFKAWLTFVDEIDSNVLTELMSFIQNALSKEDKIYEQLLFRRIEDRMKNKQEYVWKVNKKTVPPPKISVNNLFSEQLNITQIDPKELARQITISTSKIFRKITPYSLITLSWVKEKMKHKGIHIMEMIEYFFKISGIVKETIVLPKKLKDRKSNLIHFIKTASYCSKLQNFDSMMAISADGLHSNPILRLKKTAEEIPKKYQQRNQEMLQILESKPNSILLRKAYKESKGPMIPYLVTFLADMIFVSSAENNINGLINFQKRKALYRVLKEIHNYQNKCYYNFTSIIQIQKLIHNFQPSYTNSELFKISQKREPKK
ncbi:guanine nucleotide exchange factor [Anaeramoeba flamelloides]|uniref:Guanine nucleotide exchange factor n=1 Tax=Anaeramoeba flamelloides TaxID=1746091 RepID=A0ABQ8Z1V7_9EUKA|nr:guanine nucleotide exchange factor [Anaeramoeba flamelloides]